MATTPKLTPERAREFTDIIRNYRSLIREGSKTSFTRQEFDQVLTKYGFELSASEKDILMKRFGL